MQSTDFIDFYQSTIPREVVEMDEQTFQKIRTLRDAEGIYLYVPHLKYPKMLGTFLGMSVSVVESDKRFLQMCYLFPDGHRHVVEMDLPKQENGQ